MAKQNLDNFPQIHRSICFDGSGGGGGGGILKTDSKIIRRNLDLSFQEGSKWFRHSVSKICYRARVSKDPDEVPKT